EIPGSSDPIPGSTRTRIDDQAVKRASLPQIAPAEFSARPEGSDAPTALEPLPAALTQAVRRQPPRGAATRAPTTVPQPPSPAPPQAPRRDRQAAARLAPADAEQQIQFDRNGLVTMHVNELDVRQLLELLSRRSGLNILVSPKVSGTITANFEGTTVNQVLKAV